VTPNFIYWAMSGKPLPITGTGEETRDFTFVGDIVDGLLRSGVMKEAVGRSSIWRPAGRSRSGSWRS
jgi:nucleoside-diphosphate-sugar epimerase